MLFNYCNFYWAVAISLFFIFYLKQISKSLRWSFVTAIGYTLFNAYFFLLWTDWKEPYSPQLNMVLAKTHLEAILFILIGVFVIKNLKMPLKFMAYLCIANIVITITRAVTGLHLLGWQLSGLSENPAMNASITSITLPFLFLLEADYLVIWSFLGIITILLTRNFTPILALLMAFLGPPLIKSDKAVRNTSIAIILVTLACFFFSKTPHIQDRIFNWKFFAHYWWDHFNILIGCGAGGFTIWGPLAQKIELTTKTTTAYWYWLWLHSDIYQTLFELGIIGFILWANAVWHAVYNVRKNEMLLSSSLAWLTVAMFYYPIHFPVQLFLGLYLISIAIKK